MAKRDVGASIIVPSVVHWRVGHYGALVSEAERRYLLRDPTFGNQTWMSARVIDEEASGYFLVPVGTLPTGWHPASREEVVQIYGKGHSGTTDPNETGPGDHSPPTPDCGGIAMATYKFHTLLASVSISDSPVGYLSVVGPQVRLTVTHNQREAGQPTTMAFTNLGPQWVSNWVSYLVDNPSNASAEIVLRKRGGGGEVHTGYSSGSQSYAAQRKSGGVLHRLTSNTYKKVYPDGTQEFYEQYIGTTGTERKVFLSRIQDAQGNEVALQYDSTYAGRINQIVDAAGLPTEFHYDYSGEPYLLTSVEDPDGRIASFTYANNGGTLVLQSIEDVYGIVSSFEYDSANQVVALTTPYGTTTFNVSPLNLSAAGFDLIRYVEAVDPYGSKERVEYNLSAAQTGVGNLGPPYPDTNQVGYDSGDNDDRNSFYWDKQQMKLGEGDHSKAHRYHWLQPDYSDSAVSILEREKPPLEGWIFYNYPNQPAAYVQGSLAYPSVVARIVQNAQQTYDTRSFRYEYTSIGNLTKATDPVGRQTLIEYETNGVDVATVKQKVGESGGQPVWETVRSFTYDSNDPPHLPETVTDAAGQSYSYSYASDGKVLTIENPKSETITLTYGTNSTQSSYRRLLSVTGDVSGGGKSFTYDSYARVRTVTDSEGYTLTYDYDSLDRVRVVTYPDGSFDQFEYSDHSLIASRDREGRWTRHMYNKLRQRVLTRDAAMRQLQLQWCRCGSLRRLVDGNNNITEWTRDEQGRMTKKTYADSSFYSYGYDYSGRLVTEVDAMERTRQYEYTVDDRLSKIDYESSGTPDVTFAYDDWYPRLISRTWIAALAGHTIAAARISA